MCKKKVWKTETRATRVSRSAVHQQVCSAPAGAATWCLSGSSHKRLVAFHMKVVQTLKPTDMTAGLQPPSSNHNIPTLIETDLGSDRVSDPVNIASETDLGSDPSQQQHCLFSLHNSKLSGVLVDSVN